MYKDVTSAVTKKVLDGKGGIDDKNCLKCLLSCMYVGMEDGKSLMKPVTNLAMVSVGELKPETIGRSGMSCLCILGSPYKMGVRLL